MQREEEAPRQGIAQTCAATETCVDSSLASSKGWYTSIEQTAENRRPTAIGLPQPLSLRDPGDDL